MSNENSPHQSKRHLSSEHFATAAKILRKTNEAWRIGGFSKALKKLSHPGLADHIAEQTDAHVAETERAARRLPVIPTPALNTILSYLAGKDLQSFIAKSDGWEIIASCRSIADQQLLNKQFGLHTTVAGAEVSLKLSNKCVGSCRFPEELATMLLLRGDTHKDVLTGSIITDEICFHGLREDQTYRWVVNTAQ